MTWHDKVNWILGHLFGILSYFCPGQLGQLPPKISDRSSQNIQDRRPAGQLRIFLEFSSMPGVLYKGPTTTLYFGFSAAHTISYRPSWMILQNYSTFQLTRLPWAWKFVWENGVISHSMSFFFLFFLFKFLLNCLTVAYWSNQHVTPSCYW